VPETIISRTQSYGFKSVDKESVARHLKGIATSEKIKIDDQALDLIAVHGGGSFRDSISILDQVSGTTDGKEITAEDVSTALGVAPTTLINDILENIVTGNSTGLTECLNNITDKNLSPSIIAKQIIDQLREDLKLGVPSGTALDLIDNLLEVSASSMPMIKLELVLYRAHLPNAPVRLPEALPMPVTSKPEPKNEHKKPKDDDHKHKPSDTPKAKDDSKPKLSKSAKPDEMVEEPQVAEIVAAVPVEHPVSEEATPLTADIWQQIIDHVKLTSPSQVSSLRLALPIIDGDKLVLKFAQAFHQKRNSQAKVKDMIAKASEKVIGVSLEIISQLESDIKPLLQTTYHSRDVSAVTVDQIAALKQQGASDKDEFALKPKNIPTAPVNMSVALDVFSS
jgi:DNA polymerase III gamma/tau subunit